MEAFERAAALGLHGRGDVVRLGAMLRRGGPGGRRPVASRRRSAGGLSCLDYSRCPRLLCSRHQRLDRRRAVVTRVGGGATEEEREMENQQRRGRYIEVFESYEAAHGIGTTSIHQEAQRPVGKDGGGCACGGV